MDEHKARLADALTALGGVYPEDLVNLPQCESIIRAMKDDGMNAGTAGLIVRLAYPNLFTDYGAMSDQEFANADCTVRAATRKDTRVRPSPYSDLRADELSDSELIELERAMLSPNAYDRGVLERARQRQRSAK